MPADPRSLILSLLLGAERGGDNALAVPELLAAAALFGLPENAVRVALTRAAAAGLLVSPARGHYALGPVARPLADAVLAWQRLPERLVDWQGEWLAVHVGAAGRSDRPALRARERAFGLLGLAEFERGLHLRPANLVGGVETLRERLAALLPDGAAAGTVFVIGGLSAADSARACSLWDTAALDAGYRDGTARLAAWLDAAPGLALEQAARESFELGGEAIRRLVFDPLLPAPLVDAEARARYVRTVERFDAAGQALWQGFLARSRAARAAEPEEIRR
ncbi:PaaX family transcriptional regulator C-terminal domain-containing protein [Rubrivivax gelatinosus]|uniref:PaaX family transcriptional regulator n=1 Tax=Rubrivivax gelatinosus TaxID=28068 RepID=A0A4R2MCG7_RUBGE|nr:PaaX family transcriptional regulator C-terminal domain-containing protein [Rubrivivax gelatinosus]MBK1686320.1 hypothetical protein [Rubrivivax gelatinosus]TCP04462.1 PaaX family transcriptional regulator [Rubrivivax gelatinosus]